MEEGFALHLCYRPKPPPPAHLYHPSMLRTSTLTIAVIAVLAAASLMLTAGCTIHHPRPDWADSTFNGLRSYPDYYASWACVLREIDRPADKAQHETLSVTYKAYTDDENNGPNFIWYSNGELMSYSVWNRGQNGIPLYQDPVTQFYPNGLLLSYSRFYEDRNITEDNFYDRAGNVVGSITYSADGQTATYRWGGEELDNDVFAIHLRELYRDAGYNK